MAFTKTLSAKNKAFWAKSKAAQCIAVAKDVLQQIDDKFYRPTEGEYFQISKLKNEFEAPDKLDAVFATLKQEKAQCEVCGIGGCFVSLVNLGNKMMVSDAMDVEVIANYDIVPARAMRVHLRKVFTRMQLTLIETAFEKVLINDNGLDLNDDDDIIIQAVKFGRKYESSKGRLIAIMKNIIKNKGEFKP